MDNNHDKGKNRDKMQVKAVLASDRTKKEKFLYLVQYYWKIVLAVIVVLGLLTSLVVSITAKKSDAFNVGVYTKDYYADDSTQLANQIDKWITYDKHKSKITVSWNKVDSPAVLEKMAATISTHDVDLMISDKQQYDQYLKQKGLRALPLTKAQVARYHDLLVFDKKGRATGIRVGKIQLLEKMGLQKQILYVFRYVPHEARIKTVVVKLLESTDK